MENGAVDYDAKSDQAQLFFKKVLNKMLWAVTQQTAAELIVGRTDPKLPNMGLKSWDGSRTELFGNSDLTCFRLMISLSHGAWQAADRQNYRDAFSEIV
jgi:Virulence protein RhuM family